MGKKPHVSNADILKVPPFETNELRRKLTEFLQLPCRDSTSGKDRPIGAFKWGVYAFFDYDGEPIYVGQTKEKISTRIRRHLTNQRTDAVAMSVLDPFEVSEIQAWPLAEFQGVSDKEERAKYLAAKAHLDALEFTIFKRLRAESHFKAILNEKDPPLPTVVVQEPISVRRSIVSEKVLELRQHPDIRIARRALIVSRLAQVISERDVKFGLRRVLVTQAKRLQWLAERRFEGLGGEGAIEQGPENDDE